MVKKAKKSQKGKGIIDGLQNMVLSTKLNKALPNERHQIIKLPDGSWNPAVYSGPGTNLETRIRRGDKPLSYVDKTAEAHDLRYALARTDQDVRDADNRMVQQLNKATTMNLDSQFNIKQANLIKAKILMEDHLGVPKSWFTSFGREGTPANDIQLYESTLKSLEQQGFGHSKAGIKDKHYHHCPL